MQTFVFCFPKNFLPTFQSSINALYSGTRVAHFPQETRKRLNWQHDLNWTDCGYFWPILINFGENSAKFPKINRHSCKTFPGTYISCFLIPGGNLPLYSIFTLYLIAKEVSSWVIKYVFLVDCTKSKSYFIAAYNTLISLHKQLLLKE